MLFVAGLLVAVAATAHASVLDTGDIESFESVGLPMDIPQEQIQGELCRTNEASSLSFF